MVVTIENHAIIAFNDKLHVAAQQMKSRLRPFVYTIPNIKGEQVAYDGLGTVEAREINGRHVPIIFDEIEHLRRELTKRRFSVTLPIDGNDVSNMLEDPSAHYTEAIMAAIERVYDRVIYDALFANVRTGRDFTNTVTFAGDGGLTVNATGGLTYEKLLEVKQNFMDNDIATEDNVPVVLGFSGAEHTRLMGEIELISGDYSRQYVVDGGSITKAMGMDCKYFGANARIPVLKVAGGVRDCFALAERGIALGVWVDKEGAIEQRVDLEDTKQVRVRCVIGAVRTEGNRVQKITTTV